jgi:NAD(P)-dependent dehydrogenase (short-subunit alcohol dehydrogenase family)
MFDLGLDDKVVLITGGSDGLGRATAERFALEGAKVVICARRSEHLFQVVDEIQKHTMDHLDKEPEQEIVGYPADVTNPEDCASLISNITLKFGGIDFLINNAGASAAARLEKLNEAEWLADFHLKVMSAVRLSKLVVPSMRLRGGGCIINASIGGGKAPAAGSLPTSVMRSAGLNLTKSLANEFAAERIRVNAICIGLIKSMQWVRRAGNKNPQDLYDEMAKRIPLGRVGEPEEYADLVAFLCSKRAQYITGTAINMDGGMCPVI